ncbi:SCO-spondin isoform X14 [Callithrix jacchus]
MGKQPTLDLSDKSPLPAPCPGTLWGIRLRAPTPGVLPSPPPPLLMSVSPYLSILLTSVTTPGSGVIGQGFWWQREWWQQRWFPIMGRRWCEWTESIRVEEELAPRQEELVPCASLDHYSRLGWRLDLPWSGRVGFTRSPAPGLCPIYKPPETRPATWNRTVRACCPGWGGAHCTEALTEASREGHCFAMWQCQLQAGSANASAGSLEECCARPWGRSWQDGSSQACLSCPSRHLPGSASSPAPLQPLAGAVGQLWSQHQHPSATCASWSGFHYRTFDGRHYHFLGRCTYLLAGAADSTWAVHLRPGDRCPQLGHCQLVQVTMGREEVLIQAGTVSVKGQLVPEGQSWLLHGLSLQWLGDWLVLSGGLGVVVRLDRAGSISISVDHELWGQTQGLCGLYNGRPEGKWGVVGCWCSREGKTGGPRPSTLPHPFSDDFMEPGGELAMLAATFGNSWRFPDTEPGCLDAVEVAKGCDGPLRLTEADVEPGHLRAEAQDMCHQLLEGPFRQCHAQVSPAEYHEACLFAYCAGALVGGRQEGWRQAVCATFANYAQACARRHIHIRWRKPDFCERLCPGGQLYSECISLCPPSCETVGQGEEESCGEECVSGCECPRGLFWNGTLCVPAAQCPCYYRRQRYAPRDTVYQLCNPCVCKDGRWHCAQALCPAECALGGDGHYLTFDGRSFSFRGGQGCRYSLVQDYVKGQLLILLEHGACEAGSCLHAISVSLKDTHIQLRDSGAVLVNGQDVGLPWIGTEGLSVRRASSSFLLLRWPGAQVLWGLSDPAAYITLDPRHAHQVQGLCGTFTQNQQDDFLTPAGDVETSIAAFASKFQVASKGRCPSGDHALLSPCTTHSQRHAFAEATCAVLHSPVFQECHGLVDREPFHLRCLAAMCGCDPGSNCLCPVLSAYAHRCAQEGASPPWRNQTLCPVLCPGGQEYRECTPVCGQHCGEPEDCGELGSCVAGCNCPPGLLWDLEGQCVPPSLCPCQLGARRYAPGSAAMKDCNRCICQERGLWNCTGHHCPPQQAFCPRELVYAPGACLLTCDSPSANHSCPAGRADGCVCPSGMVLLDERCVPPDLCPCRHSGQWYLPNATIQEDCNVCVCRGRQWHCTGQRCSGRCQASGAPHYVTFDGLAFTFPGACEYLLVREASGLFTVSAQNLPCGASGLTCTKALAVRLEGTAVHMLRGRAVTVNGVSVTLPKVYTGPGLSLRHAGLFLLLSTRLGLTLLWDGGTRVLVQLSPQFRGRVAGLCGDFDGDASNDLRSRQGVLEPTAELAAHSWRLSPLCPEPGDLPHPCTVNSHRAGWARARCGVLLQPLFKSCHVEVPPQQHYEWCLYDACGCDSGGDCECLCSAIATYADECARHGHHVRWRSQELCPLQCEGGQVYEACGPTCPPTCHEHHPEPGRHCQVVACVEGCFCPEGTLLHGGACLEPASCPCEWGSNSFPPGSVLQKDCGNCTCQEGQWHCGGDGAHCEELVSGCAEGEVMCQVSGHCVPHEWLCDNQDDCGDGSDEEGCATPGCGEGQMACRSGHCLPLDLLCDGRDDCGDGTDEQGCPCPQGLLACADGRCLPPALLCDGHPDCLDAADEESCLGQVTCVPGEVSCVDGTCLGAIQLCDGIWDCPDGADEGPGHCPLPSLPMPPAGTVPSPSPGSLDTMPRPLASASPAPPCGPFEFPCGSGECTPLGWRCDQEEDCADGSDERDCGGPCAPHLAPCARGPHCVSPEQLCDGVWQCPDGSDEGPDACGSTQLPPCPGLFPCGVAPGLCLTPKQLCDGIPDCPQGEDELDCGGLPAPGGPNRTGLPCPEYTCPNGTCIGFQLVRVGLGGGGGSTIVPPSTGALTPLPPQVCDGQPDCGGPGQAGSSPEEQGCGAWGPWSPWGTCSHTCGPGVQARSRRCTPPGLMVLQHCPGPEQQSQACFMAACPVDGEWSAWSPWSLCSEPCKGTITRQRQCHPPQNGGLTCAALPGGPHSTRQTKPCPQDGCLNATCSGELVFRPCAPCPLTCDDISGQVVCPSDRPCGSPGCWCPEGQVLGSEGWCVWPRQCPCRVDGAHYWPGQRIKADCQLCICQDGRPRRCRLNPDCAVHCGWSSWSPWAECLGPCGSQSIQWSFRSPNNPRPSGRGHQCRGIHRKARRCQTEPCEGCEHRGQVHRVGERWRGGPCRVCQCLHNLTTRCSTYCPLGGCPQGWVLVEGTGESCCHCALPENRTVQPMATPTAAPVLSPQIGFRLATYILPPLGDPCYSPLGLARLAKGSLHASSQQLEHPTWAVLLGAPTQRPGPQGWRPGEDAYAKWHTQPHFLQLDLFRPRNLTGIIVPETGSSNASATSFSLQFSSSGLHWHDYHDILPGILPLPKLLPRNWDNLDPTVWTFGRMVEARFVRVRPHDDHHSNVALPVELLGCEPGSPLAPPCPGVGLRCASGECALRGGPCNGVLDCEDGSDEEGCVLPSEGTSRVHSTAKTLALSSTQPGQLPHWPREGLAETEHWPPGQESTAPTETRPVSPGPAFRVPDHGESMQTVTTTPVSQMEARTLPPGMAAVTILPPPAVTPVTPAGQSVAPGPFPPVQCGPGQMPCEVLGCVEQVQVCDGREDCLDGSDERHCASTVPFTVPTTALPGLPASRALCSPSQLSCGSGECLSAERRCDLRPDCQDGSDEDDCVDCVLAPWSGWSTCSRTCGLGLTFQRQELLRPPLPGGSCPQDRFRSQSCFVQACPVAGAWAMWEAWGPCSASCGGGHQSRRRSCVDPPPKNGGAPCPGPSQERAPCGLQPCSGSTADCELGRVYVSADLCQKGLVPPCPPSCLDPKANRSCSGHCVAGCRCPPGLLLHDTRCLPLSECPCVVGEELKWPGVSFLLANCSQCMCEKGDLLCQPGGCPLACGWSAWSSWTPCDHSCGSGVRARFRSPSNPPAAWGGAPCEGNRQELQGCHTECGTEVLGWTPWTSWSSCSQSCLAPGGRPGWRSRSRLCSSPGDTSCPGDATQEEPCSPPVCPVPSVWGLWAPWSTCSAPCDGGIQTRGRSCSSTTPGDTACPGPHSQTRDCNTQPCTAQCPENMVFRSAEQCRQEGGPCPRLCLTQGPGIECTGFCAPGCTCPPGLFLHNASCLPRSQCPCQLHGQLYAPGAMARLDSCNNCTCVSGAMACTSEHCPVACGWSPWTPWSLCSRSCNVGIRRRFRAGTAPPAAFGGAECQGPSMEAEFCSLWPCRGPGGEWGPWSLCSVPCGGGYRNRTRGSGLHSPVEFSPCGLQPCAGKGCPEDPTLSFSPTQGTVKPVCHPGSALSLSPCAAPTTTPAIPRAGATLRLGGQGRAECSGARLSISVSAGPVPGLCPRGKQWLDCAQGPASCAELSAPRGTNQTCHPGCYCPSGMLLLNNVCVPTQDCPCAHEGHLHPPGSTVVRPCENCSCVSGLIANCSSWPCAEGQPAWSPWTPWSQCSASCSPARRHRHRFCARSPSAAPATVALLPLPTTPTPLCPGPEAEEEPCDLPGCDGAGGWGPWGPWSHCSRSCGGGLRSRTRACDQPPPQGLGDYCEGPRVQGEACQALPCPVTNCTAIEGAEFSPCGPPCPRSCDDLVHCVWRCQPGCYCPPGQVLSSNGAICVQPGHCGCLDLLTGQRHHPGTWLARPDGCNHCTCLEGRLNCTDLPCPVPGGWCPWSEWTACSQPCRGQTRSRSRACTCPAPQHGGSPCPGQTGEAGAQHQREACPSSAMCPVDGAWGPWGPWSPCDTCLGQSHRSRACSRPPTPVGGRPCPGGHTQSRPCQDNSTRCTDCGGGQSLLPCGQPCPRSCQDLSPGSVCQPGSAGCQPSCGCPPGQLSQDGLCVPPAHCRCQYQPGAIGIPENQSRSAGSRLSSWESLEPGEMVTGPCDNCTCVAGILQCQEVPGCPDPGVWSSWGPWEDCSVSCGGGEQLRSRRCARPPCPGPARQSRICSTQVCREVGCPAGRLYRECQPGEGCPFSCAHVTQQVGCFSEGCEEGCHCPEGTFQHRLACVQECPCVLTAWLLQELGATRGDPGQSLGPGDELGSGQTLHTGCGNCSCAHGKLSCSLEDCFEAGGGFGPWSPWGRCSRSCGGLGTRTRSRQCVLPMAAPSGQGCRGPRQDLEYCPSPDCPGAEGSTVEAVTHLPGGWGPWSPWSPCSRSCTDPARPAWRSRTRLCLANCTVGDPSQERPCNLPSCTELPLCPGPGCGAGNCSWTSWAPWEPCSRSCGVGQQRRLRAYRPPGPGGHWCPDILTAYQERRFCNLRACPVPGGWSRWSPWSWCDRSCGGGRSLRSRSCSSPPPKNGGAACAGERHQARLCNSMPCETGCPEGMEVVTCANRCPHRCSDLQEGIVCQDDQVCQRGCRCLKGSLEQDGGCVPIGHCDCTDAQGHRWAPGSQHQDACNNCSCQAGRLSCTAQPCPPPTHCAWGRWSAWSPCSHSCGPGGQQSRFRSSSSGSWAPECREEQSQSQPCPQSPCPPLCLQGTRPRTLGDSWLQGECQQCSCTPEGVICEDTECAVPEAWTLWSPWSSCPVSCGGGNQVRIRACRAAAPPHGSSPCPGPDTQTQPCGQQPCPELLGACTWGPWGPCSRSCGLGLASRSGSCPCLLAEADPTCNGTFLHLDTRGCYPGPCPEVCVWSSWSSWTRCSCQVLVQQRYRHQGPASQGARAGAPCTRLDGHLRPCPIGNCSEDSCTPPFEFQACGSPCAGLCATHLSRQLCQDLPPCQPGCYCPKGLLEQAGGCIPPEQCNCWHTSAKGARVTLAPGDRLQLGCKECECRRGELQCTSQGCQGLLPLSEWSEWSPCGPCLPPSTLAPASRTALQERWLQDPTGLSPTSALLLASEQHRHRLCLDPATGGPWTGAPHLCTAPLSQQRLCPDPRVCPDSCQWSPWGPWSSCQVPCSGGFRLRWREAGAPHGGGCRGPWAQTESCNRGPCPGNSHPPSRGGPGTGTSETKPEGELALPPRCAVEGRAQECPQQTPNIWPSGKSCEARDTVLTSDCANRCPRSCVDLWDRVQCLQGPCHPGCRCPPGQLVQDGRCVPISSCRCGLPSANASWELAPGHVVQLDCKNCTCVNGSLVCPRQECPVLGPWSAWSSCSAPCGGGTMARHRSCKGGPGVAACQAQDTEQWQECNLKPCPECPPGQVLSACATSCPHLCWHLQPGAICVQEPCQPGCGCPGGQLLHHGTCVPPAACPCTQHSLPWGFTLTPEEQAQELPPGTVLTQNCTRCVCRSGVFSCSLVDCQECPPGEAWQQVAPGELGLCEQTCQEMTATETPGNCSSARASGCVCQPGHFRSQVGSCVPKDRCECWHLGRPHLPGSEWQEACESCVCLSGRPFCTQRCSPLTCAQGEEMVLEPGSCCPTCHRETLEEQMPSCHLLTELRNLTKGPCYLDQVEVNYCSGHCPSSTHVMPEEPYLQSQCDCCSYRLDPESPVRILSLRCPGGHVEPVVLPVIHSCQCSSCQGGDFSKR